MIRYNESGWLFQTSPNEVHELTEADINNLLLLAEEDDAWADRVRQEVIQRDQNFGKRKESRSDWLIDELRIMKMGGTVIQFPSSLRIITFPSKRHLFRGERKKYEACIPSLKGKEAEIVLSMINSLVSTMNEYAEKLNSRFHCSLSLCKLDI